MFPFSKVLKWNLNSTHLDLMVSETLEELLLIIKKKVLAVGSSNDLSKAFDELRFKYSALSNKTILMSRE